MEKTNIMLVVMNRAALEETVKKLDFDKVNLTRIFTDGYDRKTFNAAGNEIPVISFATIYAYLWQYRRFKWLIGGGRTEDIRKMRKFFLAYRHIPEGNIISLEGTTQISESQIGAPSHVENNSLTLLANLRHIEEHGADFFVTGNEYTQLGLNLNFIPRVQTDTSTIRGGVVLADTNQTLRQSYQIAEHVFAHVAPGTIKFVLIGLTPDSFRRDDDSEIIFESVTDEQADLNFDSVKTTFNNGFSAKAVIDWQDAPNVLPTDTVEKNVQILKDYIELCLANGAKPVGVVFPFAPAMRRYFDAELLKSFRETIHQLEENHDFTCVDMFELNLNYDCFCDMTHLNARGQTFANTLLASKLQAKNLIPIENFCDMSYEYFNNLSNVALKNEYNTLMERVFAASAAMIRRKNKIKVGFVLYDASMWCGDDLYNYFARDERFEPTVFLCLRTDKSGFETVKKDFWHGVEQFKSRELNVVALDNPNATVPAQDVIIYLAPYMSVLPMDLQIQNFAALNLVAYVTYALDTSRFKKSNFIIFHTAWKSFFSSNADMAFNEKYCSVGVPRGLYSGYPRMDIFFKRDTDFHFEWKMTCPDAKKIIWAPHWSINIAVRYATFQWNYKFMYEFAKAHPEISWVVKPHPNLLYQAIRARLFNSVADFEKYLQAWNDLPNAQVYTGGYYQNVFATSDGMIHDSGSFIAEYQYVDNPMIYLTRDTQRYNDLGNKILNASYCVDGQDFDAIAAIIQRVIIEGDDYKAEQRREVFNKYLNYPKANGMLASEFIYHSIADELKGASE